MKMMMNGVEVTDVDKQFNLIQLGTWEAVDCTYDEDGKPVELISTCREFDAVLYEVIR